MRVVLLAHAATPAVRAAAFAGDGPLDQLTPDEVKTQVTVLGVGAPRAERACAAPSARCRLTAAALGLTAAPEPALAGCDFGRWTGRGLDAVAADEPDGVAAWLTDPAARPHGGETLAELLARVGRWLDGLAGRSWLAVADPAVIRAAVVHALDARPRSLWRVDVSPLGRTVLVGEPGRWSLRAHGRPEAPVTRTSPAAPNE